MKITLELDSEQNFKLVLGCPLVIGLGMIETARAIMRAEVILIDRDHQKKKRIAQMGEG